MLNFFKNLFGGSGTAEDHAHGNGNGNGNGYPATYSQPAAQPGAFAKPVLTQGIHQAPPVPSQSAAPVAAPYSHAGGATVSIPLHAIIAVLPLELKTRIRQTMVSDIVVSLPMDHVLAQLAGGSVKMTYGQLRALAPDVFSAHNDRDQVEIPLPLVDIISQINPAMLPRRQSQRHIHVPEEVQGPFGAGLSGVSFADSRNIAGAPAAPAQRETRMPSPPQAPARPAQPIQPAQPIKPMAPMQPIQPARPIQPIQPVKPVQPIQPMRPTPPPAAPQPPAPTFNAAPIQPAPAAPGPIPFRSSLSSTPTPPPPAATPPSANPPVRPVMPPARGVGGVPLPSAAPRMPAAPAPGNGNGHGNGNGNGHGHSQPYAAAPQAAPEVLLPVPLVALMESWPDVLRGEIVQLNLSQAQLGLPVSIVEPALKQGKVAFTWKVLRSWIRPAILPTVSAHDGMMLELPLRVIAPLFIARQKQASLAKQKVQFDESIPNLFFGFPQGDSAAAAIAEAPAAAPVPQPAPAPRSEPAPINFAPAAKPQPPQPQPAQPTPHQQEVYFTPAAKPTGIPDTNFYVWNENGEAKVDETEFKRKIPGTDFLSRHATPNEVVSRAAALEGIVGALVALPDGLMVASHLPPDVNGDTLAAFLPHIFSKVSQCTRELRMGELNNLNFTVGNVPWKIFRVNAIFFAAFGRAGQPLPTGQLAQLAGELDRKK
jgi:predicted regulator of Ras-like GTPase activity (Roadblock/LC7/MglB family)